ncbi:MAG: alanine racemase [Alkaliphilus sp.]|jgi:alanine racemase|nr:alanine racemase [bacterium AH-315-G05]PHS35958.1 MAG: alanine racemase [Alkaliphilus sp.]
MKKKERIFECKMLRPTRAEINLDYLKHNIKEVKKAVKKNTIVCAVLKADGYGHGAVEIAKTLLDNGADRFAVAILSEAIQLRKAGLDVPILVLGYTPDEQVGLILDYNLTQTVYSLDQARYFSKVAGTMKRIMQIHVIVDTGMSRLGFQATEEELTVVKEVFKLDNIYVEGMYTHFAVADIKDKTFTYQQYNQFINFTNELEKEGFNIEIKHVSNSAAIIDIPEMNLDMVRAGIMLYGLYPSKEVNQEKIILKPVMTLKTKVAHSKKLPAGRGVSYGLIYKTKEESNIVTLPIGYADGFTRMLTNKAEVTIKGEKLPVIGKICMDQSMVDATGIEVIRGDEVIIFGEDEKKVNTVDTLALKLGTINYEIVCMVGRRVPRVYIEDNIIVKVRDYVLE